MLAFSCRLVLSSRMIKFEMPGFIRPQLATPKSKAPSGDQWLHEIRYDGYRIQIHVSGRKKAYTSNGLDWTSVSR